MGIHRLRMRARLPQNGTLDIGHASAREIIKRRTPWILVGLVGGILTALVGKFFEASLAREVRLVFFIPMIVYMSDSIGTETMALFVRELAQEKLKAGRFLARELTVGLTLGLVSGIPMGIFSYLWLKDFSIAATITLAMTINGIVAVLLGMLVPFFFVRIRRDPALGSDEIATAVSDVLSLFIYLLIATFLLF